MLKAHNKITCHKEILRAIYSCLIIFWSSLYRRENGERCFNLVNINTVPDVMITKLVIIVYVNIDKYDSADNNMIVLKTVTRRSRNMIVLTIVTITLSILLKNMIVWTIVMIINESVEK